MTMLKLWKKAELPVALALGVFILVAGTICHDQIKKDFVEAHKAIEQCK